MNRCPCLGLDDDRGMYCLFPHQHHSCYRGDSPKRIAWDHQEAFCLQESYATCPVYQRPNTESAPQRTQWSAQIRPLHVIAAAVLGVAVLVLLVQAVVPGNPSDLSEPAPNYAEDATDGDQISEAPATPTVVLPMSMAAEATPRIGQFLPQTATSTATASSPTATVSVTAALQSRGQLTVSPTSTTATPVTATVSTTRTATPTPSVTPTPTRSATPTAQSTQPPQPVTPIGQGPRIHVVDYGESLSAIAERYGTTVNAIASANGLDDTSYVFTGQRLIIP